ncbi:MAG: bifunctional metallophosphatase/5'-nucleotidase, partial [Rhizobiales bacterium]|nr:bifunctional metallophosphatase/5'-nucleotidase [Hyphomicrobiales bacterium]
MIELLNITPPDVLAPGNHEFDFGQDIFLKRMAEGKFTKLGSNIRWGDGRQVEGIDDTRMFEFEGIKIGFMGLTTEDTVDISSPGDIKFLGVIETAKSNAKTLREQGADMVVAVVHTAQQVDFDLMSVAGVDVVLSGHDHNLHIFYDGRRALVESKEEAEYVTMMDIEFTVSEKRGKRRVKWWPNFRIVDTKTVTPDAEVAAIVKKYADTLSKELDVEIGKTIVELDSRKASVRTGETVLGNLIADGMRAAVNADVGFTNGGGIRGNKVYEPDTVLTRRDILSELPFGNTNVKLELSG